MERTVLRLSEVNVSVTRLETTAVVNVEASHIHVPPSTLKVMKGMRKSATATITVISRRVKGIDQRTGGSLKSGMFMSIHGDLY
jgi:hypothetical protein